MKILTKILNEVEEYRDQTVQIGEHDAQYSQHKLIKRIRLFQNKIYPKGKVTTDGDYKYWFDIIQPAVNDEVKNLRFESRNILPFSVAPKEDFGAVFILNATNTEWMRDNNKDEELHDSVEVFSSLGNMLWKKCGKGYEIFDPENTYITNQTAKTIDETAVIQRYELTQSELRGKKNWDNIENVIENCGAKERKKTKDSIATESTSPMYTVYERNGEVSEQELFEALGKEGGDEKKYLLAKIIIATANETGGDKRFVLFAESFPTGKKMSDYFIEAHRGPYKGRWWREGMYELLFDHQYRVNEIGQQIARGLEWASKAIFKDENPQFFNNIRTQLKNGRVIKSTTLSQVDVRMQGIDQLIADYNRVKQEADRIANSLEVVTGESMPAGTPFRLGLLLDQNAQKLYTHLRGKFGIAYAKVYRQFVLRDLVKDLRMKDIIRITGDKDIINKFYETVANSWYLQNLAKIGPHSPEEAGELKKMKLAELQINEPLIKNSKEVWEGILPRIHVTITGENYSANENMQTIASLIQFEDDPERRAFLMDTIYSSKGIAVPPKAQPQPQQQTSPQGGVPDVGQKQSQPFDAKPLTEQV